MCVVYESLFIHSGTFAWFGAVECGWPQFVAIDVVRFPMAIETRVSS